MHVPLGPRPAASPAHSTGRIMNNRSLDFELHEQALTDTMDERAHICMNCSASTEWLAGIIGINMMDREIVNTTTKKKGMRLHELQHVRAGDGWSSQVPIRRTESTNRHHGKNTHLHKLQRIRALDGVHAADAVGVRHAVHHVALAHNLRCSQGGART